MKIISALCLLLLVACSSTRSGTAAQKAIYQSKWELTALNGKPFTPSTQFKTPFLNFDAQTVSGNAGCNSLRGPVELKNDRLKFGALATTRMACAGLDTELAFVKALDRVDNYTIEKGTLRLRASDEVVAVFNGASK